MPVKKRGQNKKPNKKTKKDIKNVVNKLPKLIVDEVEKKTPDKNSTAYEDPGYKKKKMMMWTFVVIFFLMILVIWIINVNSVFYDFTKNIQSNNSILDKGKDAIYENDIDKMFDEMKGLLDKTSNQTASTTTSTTENTNNKESINLNDIIGAVNNFTSTTPSSTPGVTSSTEE